MEITEVRVFPVQEEKLKAFVSIVIDRCFMVNDIKVIQGKDGPVHQHALPAQEERRVQGRRAPAEQRDPPLDGGADPRRVPRGARRGGRSVIGPPRPSASSDPKRARRSLEEVERLAI